MWNTSLLLLLALLSQEIVPPYDHYKLSNDPRRSIQQMFSSQASTLLPDLSIIFRSFHKPFIQTFDRAAFLYLFHFFTPLLNYILKDQIVYAYQKFLFSLILLPINSLSLGASGCIFGLLGAAFILLAREDQSLLLLGLLYIGYFLYSSLAPGINLWAHLFGLLGGIGFGFLFTDSQQRKYENY